MNLTTFISKSSISLKSLFLSIITLNNKEKRDIILLFKIELREKIRLIIIEIIIVIKN